MYNSYNISERIKELAKNRKVSMKKLLIEVGLGFNTMSNMRTSMPKADSLAKIADYLDCSVDYLLGRTENIDSTYSINNQNSTINGTQANVINNSNEHQDDMTEEFIKAFEKLDFADKVAVMNFAISKLDK